MQPNWLPQSPQCRDERSSASLAFAGTYLPWGVAISMVLPVSWVRTTHLLIVTVHIAGLRCAPSPKHSPTDFGSSESEYVTSQHLKHRLYRKKWL